MSTVFRIGQLGMSEIAQRADADEARGDFSSAARWRDEYHRADARRRGAPEPAPSPEATMNRHNTIAKIQALAAELNLRADSLEDFSSKSNTYLLHRQRSLEELRDQDQRTRVAAVTRGDASSARAVLRLDASAPTDAELTTARATVAHSGVAPADREAVAQRLAKFTAWHRSRDALLADAESVRADSLDPGAVTAGDRGQARIELAGRPADTAAIDQRAREIAARRVGAERRARLAATLPPPPPRPRLPPATDGARVDATPRPYPYRVRSPRG